jgi:hypothetical protein
MEIWQEIHRSQNFALYVLGDIGIYIYPLKFRMSAIIHPEIKLQIISRVETPCKLSVIKTVFYSLEQPKRY